MTEESRILEAFTRILRVYRRNHNDNMRKTAQSLSTHRTLLYDYQARVSPKSPNIETFSKILQVTGYQMKMECLSDENVPLSEVWSWNANDSALPAILQARISSFMAGQSYLTQYEVPSHWQAYRLMGIHSDTLKHLLEGQCPPKMHFSTLVHLFDFFDFDLTFELLSDPADAPQLAAESGVPVGESGGRESGGTGTLDSL